MKRCVHCNEVIHSNAKVCRHCKKDQHRFTLNANLIANIISLLLLVVSIFQFKESRQERIEASQALTSAEDALSQAKKAFGKVDSLRRELYSTVKVINENTLLDIQNSWIIASNSMLAINTGSEATKQIEKNSNQLIKKIIPDSIQRKKWWNKTQQLAKH